MQRRGKNVIVRIRFRSLALASLIACLAFGGLPPARVLAATFTVDRTDDAAVSTCSSASNDCTLRGAIAKANATTAADTIAFDTTVFNSAQTIVLTTTLDDLSSDVAIIGAGAGLLTVKENTTDQEFKNFTVQAGVSATLSGLTLSGPTVSNSEYGIDNYGLYNKGTLTVTDCALSSNGEGIYNSFAAHLTVTNCTLSSSKYHHIDNYGLLTATACTLIRDGSGWNSMENNGTATVASSTFKGSGIDNVGTMTALNCSFKDGVNDGFDNHGTLSVSNCTVIGIHGTGIHNWSGGMVTVTSCTVTGNSYRGIRNESPDNSALVLKNSLVAGNTINMSGVYSSGGYNITGGTAAQAGLEVDESGTAVLADNGGPTQTIKLLPGSRAIDKGNSFGVAIDQRSLPRPHDYAEVANATGGDGSDIGAFEAQVPFVPLPTLAVNNPRSLPEGSAAAPGSVTFNITLNGPSTEAVTVNYQTRDGINNPAIAGNDYVEKHGKLTFAPGETLKRVTITFIGDSTVELNETFFFDLLTPTNASIADSRGVGQINNDDGPSITIDNARTINEGNSGTSSQTFNVHLSAPSTDTITVNWATANNTATAGSDYVAASGTLTFLPGETSKLITVLVNGDTTVEPNETYKVSLSRMAYAFIADWQGIGTIRNDDAATLIFENDEPSQ